MCRIGRIESDSGFECGRDRPQRRAVSPGQRAEQHAVLPVRLREADLDDLRGVRLHLLLDAVDVDDHGVGRVCDFPRKHFVSRDDMGRLKEKLQDVMKQVPDFQKLSTVLRRNVVSDTLQPRMLLPKSRNRDRLPNASQSSTTQSLGASR